MAGERHPYDWRMVRFVKRRCVYICMLFALSALLVNCDTSSNIEIESDDDFAEVNPQVVSETVVDEITYKSPEPIGFVYLAETFDDVDKYQSRWVKSEAVKDPDDPSSLYNGVWSIEEAANNPLKNDLGLVLKSKARHHAIAAKLDPPFRFVDKPFIVQYEVNFQNGQDCGGGYMKLLTDTPDLNLKKFFDKTPYTIMFGPDKCGHDAKLHLIFRHKNPKNGTIEEKHCKKVSDKLEEYFKDKKAHLYTLVLNPDNTFEVFVDMSSIRKGNLLEDFQPPVNPQKEIDDPNDRKPTDWDEREMIADPEATKPDDWDENAPEKIPDPNAKKPSDWLDDEPAMIADPEAKRPEDWDDDMDGEWEPPLIDNPACTNTGCGEWNPPQIDNPNYKGRWSAPLIKNSNYKGKWRPRQIINPDYFEDRHPFRMQPIGAIGLELWSMSDNIYFDNILITHDKAVADHFARESWQLKKFHGELTSDSMISSFIQYTNKNPWLWAVYVVAIGLPVVLLVVFCCSSSEDKTQAARSKKTDEPVPDDYTGIASESAPVVNESTAAGDGDFVSAEEQEERRASQGSASSEDDEKGSDESESEQAADDSEPLIANQDQTEGDDSEKRSPKRRSKPNKI